MFLNKSGIRMQVIILACICLGQILIGYTMSWTGPTIPKLRDLDHSPLPYLLTESEISLIASLLYIGAIPGPYIMGWLSNSRGRKPCLILGGSASIVANIILATSKSLAMLYCGRILAGFGIGTIAVINMVYIGEIASTSIRGLLLTILGVVTTFGSIMIFSIGPFFSYYVSIYVNLGFAFVFTLCIFFIPESPMYYVLKDNNDALDNVLQILGRLDDKKILCEVKKEFRSTSNKMDWIELFTLKTNKRGLLVVVTITILQHGSGFTVLYFFSTTILEKAGSSISADVAMIVISSFQLLGSLVASVFIEKLGRRTLLIISTSLCSTAMFILGLYFYFDSEGVSGMESVKWLPMVILMVFFVGFDFGIGVIPGVLIGEMFTSNVRSKGSAVALTCAWLAGFLVSTAFGSLVAVVGGHILFWFFALTNAFALFFTIYYIPETRGRSLLEIQQLLNRK